MAAPREVGSVDFASTAAPVRCVGRERELALLEQQAEAAVRRQQGAMVLITGPAGIGKTALLEEFGRRSDARRVPLFLARSDEPLPELVAALSEDLARMGSDHLAAQGRAIADTLHGRRPRRPELDAARDEQHRLALAERVAAFFAKASRITPFVLACDDFQNTDAATRSLLEHLALNCFGSFQFAEQGSQESLRALMILASRDEEPRLRGCATAQMALSPLDAAGVREFLALPEVVEQVTVQSGGTPSALCALLTGTPVPPMPRGEAAVAPASSWASGEKLESAFRYDRALELYRQAHDATSSETEREALELRIVHLGRLTGNTTIALEYAAALQLRRPEDALLEREIGQLHLLRDEFTAARRSLARARALTSDPAEQAQVSALLAEVDFLDGQPQRAEEECRRALASIRPSAAGSALRIELRNTLGKILMAAARYAEAEQLFEVNRSEAQRRRIPMEEARALINQGICRLSSGDGTGAERCYQSALQIAESTDDQRHRAFCLQNLGVLAHRRSHYSTALRHFQTAVGAFKKLGQRGRLAWLALDMASVYLDLRADDRAQAMVEMAQRLADRNAACAIAVDRQIIGGRLAQLRGDLTAARCQWIEARAAAQQIGQRDRLVEALWRSAQLELETGNLAAAAGLQRELEASLPGDEAAASAARQLSGELALARGDFSLAEAQLSQALDHFERAGDAEREWRCRFAQARLAEQRRDRMSAERHYQLAAKCEASLGAHIPAELLAIVANDPLRQALAQRVGRPMPLCTPLNPVTQPLPPPSPHADRILGQHPRIRQLLALIERVAATETLVLIRGESGTGKELVADALQAGSRRATGPYLKINCGAFTDSLLHSELFGHERGAFTGATDRRLGVFEAAHGGTLLLDEIGELSPALQGALLRVLQERRFERLGGTTTVQVNVRILCATHRNLEELVAQGRFRADLYYRIQGLQIELPSLRERREDIPLLVHRLVVRMAEQQGIAPRPLTPAALELLSHAPWPGNVRELENVLRAALLLVERPTIDAPDLASHFPEVVPRAPHTAWAELQERGIGLRELQERIEIECIQRALTESNGNITHAAARLKMKRPRLSQLIKAHGIPLREEKP